MRLTVTTGPGECGVGEVGHLNTIYGPRRVALGGVIQTR